ncbi:MAG: hypothetical protein ACRD1G_15325 [Acidimicrobiales bacterium]
MFVHSTSFQFDVDADPTSLGVVQEIYRALVQDEQRNAAIIYDVEDALQRGRHCLILTSRTAHMEVLAQGLREAGYAPVLLHGKLGAKARRAAVGALQVNEDGRPLLAVATGSYIGEGFDCPALDTVFLV